MKMMKYFLTVPLSILLLYACAKEPGYGTDPSLPGPVAFVYDGENSSDTDMAFSWDASEAISAGARSFTVEVLSNASGFDVNPDHRIVLCSDAINDCASFTGYKKGLKYYIRARANYSAARYSEWVWLMDGDEKAIVKVGTGLVDPYEDLVPASQLGFRSAHQIGINCSASAFKDRAGDIGYAYRVALFKDEAGNDLCLALDLPAGLWESGSAAKPAYFPGVVFSGLEPATDYWCRITVLVGKKHPVSEMVKYTTPADDGVRAASLAAGSAEVGDVLLTENFDCLFWGGSYVNVLPGIMASGAHSASSIVFPAGDCTSDNAPGEGKDFYYGNFWQGESLLAVMKAVKGSGTSFGDEWGLMLENTAGGEDAFATYAGSVLVGGAPGMSGIVVPALQGLRSSATVKFRFRACNWFDAQSGELDPSDVSVWVFDKLSLSDASVNLYGSGLAGAQAREYCMSLSNDSKNYGWKDYEVTLDNIGPDSRIVLGTPSSGISGGLNRMFIDRVEAVLFKYDDEDIKPESRLAFASSGQLGIQMSSDPAWNADENVKYDYTAYLYRDEACTDIQLALELPKSLWSTRHALNKEDHPGFVFGGLAPSTDYWLKIVCHHTELGDITSDAVRYSTSPDRHVNPSAAAAGSAQPGDILIRESFDDMQWFGDHVQALCGVSRKDRKTFESISFPTGDRTGDNAISTSEKPGDFNLVKWSNEVALSDISVPLSGTDSDFCREWGYMIEASGAAVNGLTCRAGSLKIGGSSKISVLVAPAIPALKGPATVKVRFRACNYTDATKTTFDTPTKALFVFDGISKIGGSWNLYDQFYSTATKQEVLFDLTDTASDYGWKDYELILEHVLPTSHIGIGGTRQVLATGQNRFFVDDIEVELVKYE